MAPLLKRCRPIYGGFAGSGSGALRVYGIGNFSTGMDEMDEEYGPCMRVLTAKQRQYVLAMLSDPLSTPAKWAREAGYSNHMDRCKVTGHYNAHNDRIEAAAREEAARHLNTVGPVLAIGVMLKIARDSGHKRQLDAAAMLADRSGFHMKTEHRVTVEHVADDRMLEIARRMAKELGVEEMKLVGGNVIEGEVSHEAEAVVGIGGPGIAEGD